MKKTFSKIFNVVIDILIVLVLVISVITLISVFATTRGGEGVPNLFGKAPISVLTDSMKGDASDNFNKGDLLICNGGDVGRAAIWCYDYNICLQNHISFLRIHGGYGTRCLP